MTTSKIIESLESACDKERMEAYLWLRRKGFTSTPTDWRERFFMAETAWRRVDLHLDTVEWMSFCNDAVITQTLRGWRFDLEVWNGEYRGVLRCYNNHDIKTVFWDRAHHETLVNEEEEGSRFQLPDCDFESTHHENEDLFPWASSGHPGGFSPRIGHGGDLFGIRKDEKKYHLDEIRALGTRPYFAHDRLRCLELGLDKEVEVHDNAQKSRDNRNLRAELQRGTSAEVSRRYGFAQGSMCWRAGVRTIPELITVIRPLDRHLILVGSEEPVSYAYLQGRWIRIAAINNGQVVTDSEN